MVALLTRWNPVTPRQALQGCILSQGGQHCQMLACNSSSRMAYSTIPTLRNLRNPLRSGHRCQHPCYPPGQAQQGP